MYLDAVLCRHRCASIHLLANRSTKRLHSLKLIFSRLANISIFEFLKFDGTITVKCEAPESEPIQPSTCSHVMGIPKQHTMK